MSAVAAPADGGSAPKPRPRQLPIRVKTFRGTGRQHPTSSRDPTDPAGPANCHGPGNGGGRRKAVNRRDLPRLWDFLIRARLVSRKKPSAEPNGCPATNEPR